MNAINNLSLREQVYDILRQELKAGRLQPGQTINLNAISERLGISRTPLREALLRLEQEGFVVIKPRSGITVRVLTEHDIRNLYQMIGALEASVLLTENATLTRDHLKAMRHQNEEMKQAIKEGDFDRFYQANLALHDAYLQLSSNADLVHQVQVMKQRLYDFTPSRDILRDWEWASTSEHEEILQALEKGDFSEAARLVRDVHWSFRVQEQFIRRYYLPELQEQG